MDDSSSRCVKIPLVWNAPTCDRCGHPEVDIFQAEGEFCSHVGQRELSPISRLRRNHDTSNACKLKNICQNILIYSFQTYHMKSLETVCSKMKSRTENQQYTYVSPEGQQSLEDIGWLSSVKQIWRFLRID